MLLDKLKRRNFDEFKAYVPGWQPPDIEKWIKLNTNENPYGPPKEVLDEIKSAVNDSVRLYPDPTTRKLRELLVKMILRPMNPNLTIDNVMCGLGSDEILDLVMRAFIDAGDRIVFFRLSYGMYDVLARVYSASRIALDLDEDFKVPQNLPIPAGKLLILCSPNNPNGKSLINEEIGRFCCEFPGLVIVDEAYADFASTTAIPLLTQFPNLGVVRTFSKSFSLAGERIGFLVGSKELVDALNTVRLPFNLTRLNQAAGIASLRHYDKTKAIVAKIIHERERLTRVIPLRCPSLKVLPSDANFLLIKCPSTNCARAIMETFIQQKILIRYFEKPGLETYVRMTVGTESQNEIVLANLEKVMKNFPP
ncbi:MAG: histidinol-phosphate aminotransferase [Promethearchaeota archaeon CR_4]|nr:MAG: histidinol-phosphate aminotransferase [Candidatus Lokiarchaeota archaeon CR_4]